MKALRLVTISTLLTIGIAGVPLLSNASYHATMTCKSIKIRVLNHYKNPVKIVGKNKELVFNKVNKNDEMHKKEHIVSPKSFYNKRCYIVLKMDGKTKKGLIKRDVTEDVHTVDIRIEQSGKVYTKGMHKAGFELKSFIAWNGLGKVLKDA